MAGINLKDMTTNKYVNNTNAQYTCENPEAPATKRQLWALFCLTKQDYRDKGLTRQQASDLIAGANQARGGQKSTQVSICTPTDLKSEYKTYMAEKMKGIAAAFRDEMKKVGTVTLEGGGTKKNYIFLGGGCGIVWLEYDKRSKLMKRIEDVADDCFTYCRELFVQCFTPAERKYLESIGNPLEAHFFQNLQTKLAYYDAICDFAHDKGVTRVGVNYRYD